MFHRVELMEFNEFHRFLGVLTTPLLFLAPVGDFHEIGENSTDFMKFPSGAKKCKGVVRDVRNRRNSMNSIDLTLQNTGRNKSSHGTCCIGSNEKCSIYRYIRYIPVYTNVRPLAPCRARSARLIAPVIEVPRCLR